MSQTREERLTKAREAQRKYRRKYPERVKATRRASWAKHGQKYNLKKKYGVTLEQRALLIVNQGGRCAICAVEFHNSKDTHVDHDHRAKRVRGILCSPCNLGVGMFYDSPEALRSAAAYLEAP